MSTAFGTVVERIEELELAVKESQEVSLTIENSLAALSAKVPSNNREFLRLLTAKLILVDKNVSIHTSAIEKAVHIIENAGKVDMVLEEVRRMLTASATQLEKADDVLGQLTRMKDEVGLQVEFLKGEAREKPVIWGAPH